MPEPLKIDQQQPPLTVARELAADYVNAHAIFLAGSVIREEATPTSDLDFVIVTEHDPAAPYRRSLMKGGWPVELFVHTPDSLEDFFASDILRRRPSLPQMCAEALIVYQQESHGNRIKERAQQLLKKGPAPLSEADLYHQRYLITDLLMDLEGSQVEAETLFIATRLAECAADAYLAFHQKWSGQGKWLFRALRASFAHKAEDLHRALHACVADRNSAPLKSWVMDCLAEMGGPRFEGHYQQAPR